MAALQNGQSLLQEINYLRLRLDLLWAKPAKKLYHLNTVCSAVVEDVANNSPRRACSGRSTPGDREIIRTAESLYRPFLGPFTSNLDPQMIPLPCFVELTHLDGRVFLIRNDIIHMVEDPPAGSSCHKSSLVCQTRSAQQGQESPYEIIPIRETRDEYQSRLVAAIKKCGQQAVEIETPEERDVFERSMRIVPTIYDTFQSRQAFTSTEEWIGRLDAAFKILADIHKQPFVAQKNEDGFL